MKNVSVIGTLVVFAVVCSAVFSSAVADEEGCELKKLPVKFEELTTAQFMSALKKSGSTCIIPCGVLEKHGTHLPIGSDLIDVREIALRAARQEYKIVFPQYYFGQNTESRHHPGAISYSPKLILNLLQETCDELSRNGVKKIILVKIWIGILTKMFIKFIHIKI